MDGPILSGGRPTIYDDTMPDRAFRAIADGRGIAGAAVECETCKRTIYNWMDQHPEFLHAVKRAEAHAEELLFKKHAEMSPASWIFTMKNRCDWVDKRETALTGANGGPIEYRRVQEMSDDELLRIASESGD